MRKQLITWACIALLAISCSTSTELIVQKDEDNAIKIALVLPISSTNKNTSLAAETLRDAFLENYKLKSESLAKKNIKIKILLQDSGEYSINSILNTVENSNYDAIIGFMLNEEVLEFAKYFNNRSPKKKYLLLNDLRKSDLDNSELAKIYQFSNVKFFSISPTTLANDVAKRAFDEGYRKPLVIYFDANWSAAIADEFTNNWLSYDASSLTAVSFADAKEIGEKISSTLGISLQQVKNYKELQKTYQIKKNKNLVQNLPWPPQLTDEEYQNLTTSLEKLTRTTDADFIYFVGTPEQGRQLRPLLALYIANDLRIFSTSYLFSGNASDSTKNRDLVPIIYPDVEIVHSNNYAIYDKFWHNNINLKRYFALGFDAFSLLPYLVNSTQSVTIAPKIIKGMVGSIFLEDNKFIVSPIWLKFSKNGMPVIINKLEPKIPQQSSLVDAFFEEN